MRTAFGRKSRNVGIVVGVFLVSIAVTTVAGADSASQNYARSSNFCATSVALVPGLSTNVESANLTALGDCQTPKYWQRNYQAVDAYTFDYPWPSAHVCSQRNYHPSGTDLVPGLDVPYNIGSCYGFFYNNCWRIAQNTVGWTYVGFPPTWQNASTITSFTCWAFPT